MRNLFVSMATLMTCAILALAACESAPQTTAPPIGPALPTPLIATVAANFELISGYRFQSDFAGEGLALVSDADGYVV